MGYFTFKEINLFNGNSFRWLYDVFWFYWTSGHADINSDLPGRTERNKGKLAGIIRQRELYLRGLVTMSLSFTCITINFIFNQ